MGFRALLLTWLVIGVAVLQPTVVDGSGVAVAAAAAALLCALTVAGSAVPPAITVRAVVAVPARQRRHGRFLQQSRPGVPGRTRARAPGCGR